MKVSIILLLALTCLVAFASAKEIKIVDNDDMLVYKYLFRRHSVFPRLGTEVELPKDGESFQTPTGYKVYKAYEYPKDLDQVVGLDATTGEYSANGGASYGSSVAWGFSWFPIICSVFFLLWILTFFCCCCCCKCGCCCCCTTKTFKMPETNGARGAELEKIKKEKKKLRDKYTAKRRNTSNCMNLVTCCLCAGSAMFFMAMLALVSVASKTMLGRVDEVDDLIGRYMTTDNDLPAKISNFVSTTSTSMTYQNVIDKVGTMTADEKLVMSSVLGVRSKLYKECKVASFTSTCCVEEKDFKLFYPLDVIYSQVDKDVPAADKLEITDIISFMVASRLDIEAAFTNAMTKLGSNTCVTPAIVAIKSEPMFSEYESKIVSRLDSAMKLIGLGDLISSVIGGLDDVFTTFDTQFAPISGTLSSTLTDILGLVDDSRDLSTAATGITSNSSEPNTDMNLLDFVSGDNSMGTLTSLMSLPDKLDSLTSTIDDLETDLGMTLSDVVDFIPNPLSFSSILTDTSDKLSVLLLQTIFSQNGPMSTTIEENLQKAEDAILDINIDTLPTDIGKQLTGIFKDEVAWDYEAPEFVAEGDDKADGSKYTKVDAHIHNIMLVLQTCATSASETISKGLSKTLWDAGIDAAPSAIYSKVSPALNAFGRFVKVMRPVRGSSHVNAVGTLAEDYEVVDAVATVKKGGFAVAFVFSLMFGFACVCTCCAGCKRSRCCSCCASIHFTLTMFLALAMAWGFAAFNDGLIEGCAVIDGVLADPQTAVNLMLGDDMRPVATDSNYDTYRKVRGELPLTSSTISQYGATATVNVNLDVLNDLKVNNLFNSFNDPKNLFVSLSVINTLNVVIDDVYSQLSVSGFVRNVIEGVLNEQVASIKQQFVDQTAQFYGAGSQTQTIIDMLDEYLSNPSLVGVKDSFAAIDATVIANLTDLDTSIISSIMTAAAALPLGIPTSEPRCQFIVGGTAKNTFSGYDPSLVKAFIKDKFYTNTATTLDTGALYSADLCNGMMFAGDSSLKVKVPLEKIKTQLLLNDAKGEFTALMLASMISLDETLATPATTAFCTANAAICDSAKLTAMFDNTGLKVNVDPATLRTELNLLFNGADGAAYADKVLELPHTFISIAAALESVTLANPHVSALQTATTGMLSVLTPTLDKMLALKGDMGTVFAAPTFQAVANSIDPAAAKITTALVDGSDKIVSGLMQTTSDIMGEDLNLLKTDLTSYMKDIIVSPVCGAGGAHPGFLAFIGYMSLGFSFILIGTCCGICASCRGLRYFRVFKEDEPVSRRGDGHGHGHDDSDSQTQYDSVYSSDVSYETSYSDYSSESPRGHHGHHHGHHGVGASNVRPLHAGADDMNAFYINT